jgi:two-component system cell cycle response regulator
VDPGLADELSLARVRENALNERIALLENAARAAATSSLVGLAPADAAGDGNRPGTPPLGGARVPNLGTWRPGQGALLTDPATGLFSEAYFEVALEARIAAARRRLRPVALVLLDIVDGSTGGDGSHADPAAVTNALRRTLREADTACRLDDGRFALVLEDTPENGAIWTVERIRTHLSEGGARCTVWAGVACYPAHAFDKDEILNQARTALSQAREWRQDRIEVAQAD